MLQKELCELIEICGEASSHFVKSEIYMNEGSIAECQQESKQGQALVNTLLKDSFVEVKSELVATSDTNTYDYPNVLELIKALNETCSNAARLLGLEFDAVGNSVRDIIAKKLVISINTVTEIFTALYLN